MIWDCTYKKQKRNVPLPRDSHLPGDSLLDLLHCVKTPLLWWSTQKPPHHSSGHLRVPQGQTVNAEFYWNVLRRPRVSGRTLGANYLNCGALTFGSLPRRRCRPNSLFAFIGIVTELFDCTSYVYTMLMNLHIWTNLNAISAFRCGQENKSFAENALVLPGISSSALV